MEKEEKKYLCIDIDNVLAQTDVLMRKIIKDETKSRVCLAYKDIIYFDYRKCRDNNNNQITNEEWSRVHNIFSEETNIMSLQPFLNVQSHLECLLDSGYELHLATTRLDKARIPTIKWLQTHKFPNPFSLHFLRHGEKHKVLCNFKAIIEDDLEQADKFAISGIRAYVIAHPWNEHNYNKNVIRIQNWEGLMEELTK